MFGQRVSRYGLAVLFTLNAILGFAAAYPGFSEARILVRQDSNLTISEDGQCGGTTGQTCVGSEFGDCCSETGWCGNNSTYCGNGCQSDGGVGICPTAATSSDGSCGGPDSISCLGSEFGNCCSARGYCGGNSSYCGAGCQSDFGQCASAAVSSDGSCGGPQGISCQGSDYGNCCSMRGYCGANTTYCGAGCQSEFGTCFPAPSNAPSSEPSSAVSSGAIPSGTADQNTAAESSLGAVPGIVEKSSLSGGAIAGIVIGSLFGIALIAFGIFFLWRRSHNKDTPGKRAELDAYSRSPSPKEVWQYQAESPDKPEETRIPQELDNPVRYEMPDTNAVKHELSVNKPRS